MRRRRGGGAAVGDIDVTAVPGEGECGEAAEEEGDAAVAERVRGWWRRGVGGGFGVARGFSGRAVKGVS